ncbi:MAG TPA: CHAT domain-containing protein [Polyangiaceae bacterium]|nr:CHAT domain-containing protein [Polyangiaceae bacterium]
MNEARWLRRFALLTLMGSLALSDGSGDASVGGLEFEFAGCARVRPGPVCELAPERDLVLWTAGTEPPRIEGEDAAAPELLESAQVEGGVRLRVRVAAGERGIRLRKRHGYAALRVAPDSESDELRELARLWKAGKWDAVRARLSAPEPSGNGPERERKRAFAARAALRAGDNERAATELEATAQSALRAGSLLDAGNDLVAAAYCRAVRLREYDKARRLLESARELEGVPEIRAWLTYYRGVLANATGDARRALVEFRRASVLARRLGLLSYEVLARQELAITLNRLHRHAEALVQQRELVALNLDAPSCLHSQRWEKLAWLLLSQPEPNLEEAAAALNRAEELLVDCPDPVSLRNQAMNRVELDLKLGNTLAARARLGALAADPSGRNPELSAWQERYFGELQLAEGAVDEAIRSFGRSEELAESVDLKSCVYSARLGRARALAKRSDEAAIAAYGAAEDAADALVKWAPFGQGQQLTASEVQQSSRELLSLLLAQGRSEEAFSVAARALQRAWTSGAHSSRVATLASPLRQRWERAVAEYRAIRDELERVSSDDWKLSLDGLMAIRLSRALDRQRLDNALATASALIARPPPTTRYRSEQDAQLLLAKGRDEWWAMLSTPSGLHAAKVAPVEARAGPVTRDLAPRLARVLEEFVRAGYLNVPLLRVTLPPELAELDVHALEVAGQPLIERVAVAYAFGPASESKSHATFMNSTIVVLGNPNGDLPWAETEAREVAGRLGAPPALLRGDVTLAAVTARLSGAGLLHFAGHGRAGGIDGIESALLLSAEQRLALGDVLALERVPDFVVLAACESTVSPEPGGAISIGQAFLLAGARAVVGASRVVSDRVSQRFARALYPRLSALGGTRALSSDVHVWAGAVRAAALDLREYDPHLDWASMRLLLR